MRNVVTLPTSRIQLKQRKTIKPHSPGDNNLNFMTKNELILQRLEQIRFVIAAQNHALAMLLPNKSDKLHSLRESDCDIGLTVLVEPGCKQLFLDDIRWLSDIQHIAFEFRRSPGHFRFLFSDGIFCDLTIVEKQELEPREIKNNSIAWLHSTMDSEIFDVAVPQSTRHSPDTIEEYRDPQWLLGELLTNLLIGLRRYNEGDKLSAFYLIQHHALSRLLTLVENWEQKQGSESVSLHIEHQSFEQNFPQLADIVAGFAQGYEASPRSAMAILDYVEQHESINYFIKDQILNLIKPHSNLH
ncbi:hypothetical protein [Planctobacterium marinum]|uniref:hypothetical protein n=1 Tax=Planctobacterium marinum TaxID=1631968 RepID=UPI001E2AFF2E|nr:hypothetical protein [Planctobacterium marinum]MCC2605425.1 hypothetical protein [Planctobacterium marinum]